MGLAGLVRLADIFANSMAKPDLTFNSTFLRDDCTYIGVS